MGRSKTSLKRLLRSVSARPTQPALNLPDMNLMEQIVSSTNMQTAWRRVKSNKGAPGIDGMTVNDFAAFAREHWEEIRRSLTDGSYAPQAVRRVEIPKPDGGKRKLGIPTVVDRVIQQAVAQVLTPLFDPMFSDSSFGFRPGRSAHGAVKRVKTYAEAGFIVAVDLDLEKFFDRVQHDVLMVRIARRVKDKRVLRLIARFLRAGVMVGGLFERTEEGTPQGGPLSPLLANILLDDLDRELEARGLRFARYADDVLILVRSMRAGSRVKRSMTQFLEGRLKLKVNETKSKIAPLWKCGFLGFGFQRDPIRRRRRRAWMSVVLGDKALERLKGRIRELTRRNRGISWESRIEKLNQYLRGWMNYFGLSETKRIWTPIDEWIRRRLRACLWKQWHRPRGRIRNLLALGLPRRMALQLGLSQKGPWRLAKTLGAHLGLDKRWFRSQGVLQLRYMWGDLAPLRRTAGCETRTSGGVGAGG